MGLLSRPELWLCGLIVFLPFIIGVGWVMPDANRRGQPGWLWAALMLPLSWMALLAYVVVRSLSSPRQP